MEDGLGANTAKYESWCRALAEQNKFQRYELAPFGRFLNVGPKSEWYLCDASGRRAKYSWQQTPRFLQAGFPMETEPLLMQLVTRIETEYGEHVNQ